MINRWNTRWIIKWLHLYLLCFSGWAAADERPHCYERLLFSLYFNDTINTRSTQRRHVVFTTALWVMQFFFWPVCLLDRTPVGVLLPPTVGLGYCPLLMYMQWFSLHVQLNGGELVTKWTLIRSLTLESMNQRVHLVSFYAYHLERPQGRLVNKAKIVCRPTYDFRLWH